MSTPFWPKRRKMAAQLEAKLVRFSETRRALPGITQPPAAAVLGMQMVASLRRLEYTNLIRARSIAPERADPSSQFFDPERAAALHASKRNIDEAFWIAFLATHFGKHLIDG